MHDLETIIRRNNERAKAAIKDAADADLRRRLAAIYRVIDRMKAEREREAA